MTLEFEVLYASSIYFLIGHNYELLTCTGIIFFLVLWRFYEPLAHRSHMTEIHQILMEERLLNSSCLSSKSRYSGQMLV